MDRERDNIGVVTDAIGQPLTVGDDVAYISKYGSRVHIERRNITDLYMRGNSGRIHLNNSNRVVMPHNVVKVSK